MRRVYLLASLYVFGTRIACADAIGLTVNDWKAKCDHKSSFDLAVCLGEVLGAQDALLFVASKNGRRPPFCIPKGMEDTKILEIVQTYVAGHPEVGHDRLSVPIIIALGKAFPAPKGGCPLQEKKPMTEQQTLQEIDGTAPPQPRMKLRDPLSPNR